MKKITVSVEEETYHSAKEWADKRGMSVPALVRELLNNLPQRSPEPPKKTLSQVIADIRARGGGLRSADNLTRDELHDRNAFR